jgi:arabinan endo-1,5-alpha-L-arabinosidase
VGEAFTEKPDWKEGGIWAPEIQKLDDKYYLYYAFSTWGDENAGIGIAISDAPEGPYKDLGKLFDSDEIDVFNSIDPSFLRYKDRNYLIWGSLGGGIFGIELSQDGLEISGEKFQLAGNSFEAAYLFRKRRFFYLFMSTSTCCEGANSAYRVVVGRSKKLKGPFHTQSGKNLMIYNDLWSPDLADLIEGVVLKGNSAVAGPGHNGQIITDDNEQDWFVYHGILRSNPLLPDGATRRPLFIDKLDWVKRWPVINEGNGPSTDFKVKPFFKN